MKIFSRTIIVFITVQMVSKTATVLSPFQSNPKKLLPALVPVTTAGIQTQNLFHSFILQLLLLLKATLHILKLLYMYLKGQLDRHINKTCYLSSCMSGILRN